MVEARGFQEALLGWAARDLRDLPWRASRDPWAILVSEVMSQQTQVTRVIPKWHAFLTAYPTPAACAQAPLPDLIALWHGLGYPRRARALRSAAADIEARHGGEMPSALSELLALPGVGAYTARAVMAFAFEQDVGVVDTNAARVLARAFVGSPIAASEVQAVADGLVPSRQGWLWNQAMLDLGARFCTKRLPDCVNCPVATTCVWRSAVLVAEQHAKVTPPDPASTTAGISGRQSRFEGSDRQGRGRLLRQLSASDTVRLDDLASIMGWPDNHKRAYDVVATLVADGLVIDVGDGSYCLAP
jgi:A/G-specific adenine glycosylase